MTGTALTEANEFHEIYKLERRCRSRRTSRWSALDQNDSSTRPRTRSSGPSSATSPSATPKGQPVLVGTISVEVSEHLSQLLERQGIPHNVLNAKQHEREAEIIKDAGERGRGHDRDQHGRPRRRHQARRRRASTSAASTSSAPSATSRGASTTSCAAAPAARATRARRASSSPPRTTSCASSPATASTRSSTSSARARTSRSSTRCSRSASRAPRSASRRCNFEIRKNVLKYDDVLNKQREVIYAERRCVLEGEDIREQVLEWIDEILETSSSPTPSRASPRSGISRSSSAGSTRSTRSRSAPRTSGRSTRSTARS